MEFENVRFKGLFLIWGAVTWSTKSTGSTTDASLPNIQELIIKCAPMSKDKLIFSKFPAFSLFTTTLSCMVTHVYFCSTCVLSISTCIGPCCLSYILPFVKINVSSVFSLEALQMTFQKIFSHLLFVNWHFIPIMVGVSPSSLNVTLEGIAGCRRTQSAVNKEQVSTPRRRI